MSRRIFISLLILTIGAIKSSYGQFYFEGRGPASIKWEQIKSPQYKLLYPDFFRPRAVEVAGFLDSITPYINYGLTGPIIRTPIILYTENLMSNGMVVWAPKRDEMVTAPPTNNFAVPWLKQLTVHESRHVAQMSSLKKGLTKIATWILGEAGLSVGLLVVSNWQLEGDAVNAETQMSEFGRALQPDFTVEYRAMAATEKGIRTRSIDKLVCGSYKNHVPDIYKFGYQVMSAGETYYSPTLTGEVFEYSAKYPILVVPDYFYLRKRYKTSYRAMTRRAFAELTDWWRPYSQVDNNFETITSPGRSFTRYDYPLQMPSGSSIVAAKRDFDTPLRFISIDSSGRERKLRSIGTISSRPIISGSKLYWTEYKPHPIWEQKNYSVIRTLDLQSGKRAIYGRHEANFFLTPMSDGKFASVSVDSMANSYIRVKSDKMENLLRYKFEGSISLHGLAWDATSSSLCFIALDNSGMWIGALTFEGGQLSGLRQLTNPSLASLRDLTAADGMLYFGSIASGKDEIHSLEIATGKQHQISTSRFGSYIPSITHGADSLLFTTYTSEGVMVAKSGIDTTSRPVVEWSRLPNNILNPPRHKWDIPKMEDLPMQDSTTSHPTKRYRRASHLFNVHSWAPIGFDTESLINSSGGALMSESGFRIGFGASLFFQSTLSDMQGALTYGWVNRSNWLKGGFTYVGLPVSIYIGAEYGGRDQMAYIPLEGESGLETLPAEDVDVKPFASVTARISLPLNFSGGANQRLFRPSFNITHYNALMYNSELGRYDYGYQKFDASLWWSNSRRASYRSIVPRLGYAIQFGIGGALNKRFGKIYSLWARGYLPGILPNHSITVRLGAQVQRTKEFAFNSKILTPRGIVDNHPARRYGAASLDYTFPICYPDGGWDGILHFKRIWTNLFVDGSYGSYFNYKGAEEVRRYHSYGVDLNIDINFFRSAETSIKLTFAGPSTGGLWFGLGAAVKF